MFQKLSLYLVVSLAVLGIAGSASAAVMNWEGTTIVRLGDFANARPTGGGVATINGVSGGLGHLATLRLAPSRGVVTANFTKFVTDPDTQGNNIASVQFIGVVGGTGTLKPISGALSDPLAPPFEGTMPLRGLVRLCLFSTACASSAPMVLTEHTAGSSTIGIGIGGLLTINIMNGMYRISVQANPWSLKTVTVYDEQTTAVNYAKITLPLKFQGWAHGPASATTSTAAVGGVVQLISASQITSNLTLGSSAKVASAQTMLIEFVPEPGMLLMLGSGIAGLVLIGRKRMRK